MWKESSIATPRPIDVGVQPRHRTVSRRKRTSFSKEHVELLRAAFQTDPYPGISLRESLSNATGLPESRIQVWFQNKRARTLKYMGGKKYLSQLEPVLSQTRPCTVNQAPYSHHHRLVQEVSQQSLVVVQGSMGIPCLQPMCPSQVKEFYTPPFTTYGIQGIHPPEETSYSQPSYEIQQGGLCAIKSSPPTLSHEKQHLSGSWTPVEKRVSSDIMQNPLHSGVTNSSHHEVFLFQPEVEQFPSYYHHILQSQGPTTPDSRCWNMGQGNTPSATQYSHQSETWDVLTEEKEFSGTSNLLEGLYQAPRPQLPALALEDILEELQLGCLDGNGPMDHHMENNTIHG